MRYFLILALFLFSTSAFSQNTFSIQELLSSSDERLGEGIMIFNKVLAKEGVSACQSIPERGSTSLQFSIDDEGQTIDLSFEITFEPGQNLIPEGFPDAGNLYDKRVILVYSHATLPVSIFELNCKTGGGYALSTAHKGQLMEQHWNEEGETKYRNTYIAQYNLNDTLYADSTAITNSGAAHNYLDDLGADADVLSTFIEYRNSGGVTTIKATCQDGADAVNCLFKHSDHSLSGFATASMNSSGVLEYSSDDLTIGISSSHPFVTNVNDYTWDNILNLSTSNAVSWDPIDGHVYFDEEN